MCKNRRIGFQRLLTAFGLNHGIGTDLGDGLFHGFQTDHFFQFAEGVVLQESMLFRLQGDNIAGPSSPGWAYRIDMATKNHHSSYF